MTRSSAGQVLETTHTCYHRRHVQPQLAPMTGPHPYLGRPPMGDIIERDLDALLLLEIHASEAFRQFLVGKATQSREERFLGAWRGVHTHRGESDLLMLSDVASRGRTALLIENKINAPP